MDKGSLPDDKGEGSAHNGNTDTINDVNWTLQTKNTKFRDAQSEANGEGVEEQQETTLDGNSESNKDKDDNDTKTDEEAEGKKPPIYQITRRCTTLEKTEVSNDRKRNWEHLKEKVPKKTCDGSKQCQMMGTAIKVDGKKRNATHCKTCMQVCHDACLFQWNKKVYCIQCYKTVVTDKYDTTTTFKEIFEG